MFKPNSEPTLGKVCAIGQSFTVTNGQNIKIYLAVRSHWVKKEWFLSLFLSCQESHHIFLTKKWIPDLVTSTQTFFPSHSSHQSIWFLRLSHKSTLASSFLYLTLAESNTFTWASKFNLYNMCMNTLFITKNSETGRIDFCRYCKVKVPSYGWGPVKILIWIQQLWQLGRNQQLIYYFCCIQKRSNRSPVRPVKLKSSFKVLCTWNK